MIINELRLREFIEAYLPGVKPPIIDRSGDCYQL